MANKACAARAKCPFYLSESPKKIRCEGLIASDTVSGFDDSREKEEYAEHFCRSYGYAKCGVYRMLSQKYGDK